MTTDRKRAYSFKDGLVMLAAKDVPGLPKCSLKVVTMVGLSWGFADFLYKRTRIAGWK